MGWGRRLILRSLTFEGLGLDMLVREFFFFLKKRRLVLPFAVFHLCKSGDAWKSSCYLTA